MGVPVLCLKKKYQHQNKKTFNHLNFITMKSLEEFVALFAEQFDDTDASEITATTVFHDLDEWSSLIGLSIIAMVDEEFDIALKGDDVKNAVTVEDLYNNVKSKI